MCQASLCWQSGYDEAEVVRVLHTAQADLDSKDSESGRVMIN